MEFPPQWKIKVKTDMNGKKTAHYIPPTGPILTNMRDLIIQFPNKCFNTFNRFTGKFEKGHRYSAYKYRKKWLPA